jgi:hypothetical protein
MEKRMGPRERAMREAQNPAGGPVIKPGTTSMNKVTLLNHIRTFKTLPTTVTLDAKKAVLLNLLLTYLNDNDIIKECWANGITNLGPALEGRLKSDG